MVDIASLCDSSGRRNILSTDRNRSKRERMDLFGELFLQGWWSAVVAWKQFADVSHFVFMGTEHRELSVILHSR